MVVGSRVEDMNLPRFAAGDTMEGDNSFIPVENELVRFSTDTLLPFTWSVPVGDVVSSISNAVSQHRVFFSRSEWLLTH